MTAGLATGLAPGLATGLAAGLAATAAALGAGPIGRRPGASWSESTRPVQRPAPARRGGAESRSGRRLCGPLPTRWVTIGAATLIGTIAVLATAGPVAAVGGLVTAAVARRSRRRRAERERADRLGRAAVELLRALATELAAGLDPPSALAAALSDTMADTEPALTAVGAALRRGEDPSPALAASQAETLRDLALAWRICQADGLRLAPVAIRLADVARSEATRRGEVQAALAGPRASGRLLAGLPAVGLILAAGTGGSPVHFLLTTAPGGACALIGGTLDLLGLAWLSRLADRAERSGPQRSATEATEPNDPDEPPRAFGGPGPADVAGRTASAAAVASAPGLPQRPGSAPGLPRRPGAAPEPAGRPGPASGRPGSAPRPGRMPPGRAAT